MVWEDASLFGKRIHTLVLIVLLLGCCCMPGGGVEAADSRWLTVKEKDLRVVRGSALDFSSMFLSPAKNERITIKNGMFVDQSGSQVRFLCSATTFLRPEGGFPSHDLADQYAEQFRMRGYNLVRMVFSDASLMAGREKDFDFDPEQLDRYYYFLSALKKRGIYLELDIQTSINGAYGDVKNRFDANKHMMQLTMHVDPQVQDHWRRMAREMLTRKNPYTGMTTADDPSLILVTLSNETGLSKGLGRTLFNSRKVPVKLKSDTQKRFFQQLDSAYQKWIEKRYGSVYRLKSEWGLSSSALPRKIADVHFPLRKVPGAQMNDAIRFISDLERNTLVWMRQYVRELGYTGPVTQYNNGTELASGIARSGSDVITMHGYHDHPVNLSRKSGKKRRKGGNLFPETAQTNISAFDNNLLFYRQLASAREAGKPYIVDEYNSPFPNRWRHEVGIIIPAYAAFQAWDGICRYANPVVLEYDLVRAPMRSAISSFTVGLDPVARAGETLSALLYRRGDVTPGRNMVTALANRPYIERRGIGLEPWPELVNQISLTHRFGVSWSGNGDDAKALVTITLNDGKRAEQYPLMPPFRTLPEDLSRKLSSTLGKSDGKFKVADGGEISISNARKEMRVITRRTIAATFERARGLQLGPLSLTSDGDAMVSLSSLDGDEISRSRRLLLIYATDARNSGMDIEQKRGARVVTNQGSLPVQMRDGKLHIQLQREGEGSLKLYALGLNGERRELLAAKNEARAFEADVALGALKSGPTTYFELVAE